ncbi:MAG: hypothetical protein EAZ53_04745 [Bacteroidetes bacterium]|nr:MAG: hypothetical protein EAZ53_04745 [Bacteroidota bacterium]
MQLFEVIENKNCRKHIRKCYTLKTPLLPSLIESLAEFGFLEVQNFSQFSPLSKDCFKIYADDSLYINGILYDFQIHLTVSLANINFIPIFESELTKWILLQKTNS